MDPKLFRWGQDNITWAGNKETNKSSRGNYVPDVIVNHISEGSAESCISWFTTPNNRESSAHFLVSKSGEVFQFVEIEDKAWANGVVKKPHPDSILNKRFGVNPNWYTVSIEHEGVFAETKGELTKAQLEATILLHKYIIEYIRNKWKIDMPISNKHIIGHNVIDSVTRGDCPGKLFPFNVIISTLNNEPIVDQPDNSGDHIGHWAEKDIKQAIELGIVKGREDGSIKPDDKITRAEVITMQIRLYNALKK